MMMYESGACTFVYFKDLLRCFLTCVLHMQVTTLWGNVSLDVYSEYYMAG